MIVPVINGEFERYKNEESLKARVDLDNAVFAKIKSSLIDWGPKQRNSVDCPHPTFIEIGLPL